MRKIGKRDCLRLICNTLVANYGGTLVEGDTDLTLAKKIRRRLTPYLSFQTDDMTPLEFKIWRRRFKAKAMNLAPEDVRF